MRLRPTVLLAVAARRQLLSHLEQQGSDVAFWVPGHTQYGLGTEVVLELAVAEEQVVFDARGVVRARRLVASRQFAAGVLVALLPTEQKTGELVLAFARGEQVSLVRRSSRRLPAMLPVEVKTTTGGASAHVTENVSREGAFIIMAEPPAVGAVLSLTLAMQNSQGGRVQLEAEVRWRRTDGVPGVGVRFTVKGEEDRQRLAKLMEAVQQQVTSQGGVEP